MDLPPPVAETVLKMLSAEEQGIDADSE